MLDPLQDIGSIFGKHCMKIGTQRDAASAGNLARILAIPPGKSIDGCSADFAYCGFISVVSK